MKRIGMLTFAVTSYVVFFGVFLYLIGFASDLLVPKSVSQGGGASLGLGAAIAVDVALIALFGLQHSVMVHAWTVDELGRRVGLSRSALGERFNRMLGESPMRYLAAWRMQLARKLMRDPRLGLSDIAGRVGYESEAAFHRAFKRDLGEPPATWRKRHLPHPAQ